MPHPMKTAILALLLALAPAAHAVEGPGQKKALVHYHGEKARRLFNALDDSLLQPAFQKGKKVMRKKIGYAISCQETILLGYGPAAYHCSQHFFSGEFTSNPEMVDTIPDSSEGPKTYSELKLNGKAAAQVFALTLERFPQVVTNCPKNEGCEYLRIARARDITCYERQNRHGRVEYDCAQYVDNQDGSAIAGGGDPMIGVVL